MLYVISLLLAAILAVLILINEKLTMGFKALLAINESARSHAQGICNAIERQRTK